MHDRNETLPLFREIKANIWGIDREKEEKEGHRVRLRTLLNAGEGSLGGRRK